MQSTNLYSSDRQIRSTPIGYVGKYWCNWTCKKAEQFVALQWGFALESSRSPNQQRVQKWALARRQSLEIIYMPTADPWALITKECKKLNHRNWQLATRLVDLCQRQKWCPSGVFRNIEETISAKGHLLQQVPEWKEGPKAILRSLCESITERRFFDRMCNSQQIPCTLTLTEWNGSTTTWNCCTRNAYDRNWITSRPTSS
jgi:hypothetical protein